MMKKRVASGKWRVGLNEAGKEITTKTTAFVRCNIVQIILSTVVNQCRLV